MWIAYFALRKTFPISLSLSLSSCAFSIYFDQPRASVCSHIKWNMLLQSTTDPIIITSKKTHDESKTYTSKLETQKLSIALKSKSKWKYVINTHNDNGWTVTMGCWSLDTISELNSYSCYSVHTCRRLVDCQIRSHSLHLLWELPERENRTTEHNHYKNGITTLTFFCFVINRYISSSTHFFLRHSTVIPSHQGNAELGYVNLILCF